MHQHAGQHGAADHRAPGAAGAMPDMIAASPSRDHADEREHDRRRARPRSCRPRRAGRSGQAARRDDTELQLRGQARGQDASQCARLRDERRDQDQSTGDRSELRRRRACSSARPAMSSNGVSGDHRGHLQDHAPHDRRVARSYARSAATAHSTPRRRRDHRVDRRVAHEERREVERGQGGHVAERRDHRRRRPSPGPSRAGRTGPTAPSVTTRISTDPSAAAHHRDGDEVPERDRWLAERRAVDQLREHGEPQRRAERRDERDLDVLASTPSRREARPRTCRRAMLVPRRAPIAPKIVPRMPTAAGIRTSRPGSAREGAVMDGERQAGDEAPRPC